LFENEPDQAGGEEVLETTKPDLFFTDAAGFESDYVEKLRIALDEHMRPYMVALAFVFNIERLRSFAIVPQTVMAGATAHHFLISEAAFAVLGRPILSDNDLDHLPDIKKKADEILLSGRKLQDGRREVFAIYSNSMVNYNKRGIIPILYDGFRHILTAQIAGAFAAFEIFSKDLWIAAVNQVPRLSCEKWFEEKTMKLGEFHRYNFDFRECLGQVLADTEKVSFDSLEKLHEAYAGAFPKGTFPGVFVDEQMKVLSEVRNVVTHNAGKADKKFSDHMRGSADWNTPMGELIPIDGRKARDLTNVAISAAVRIANGVAQHLTLHSK
jgi:hypothetical protein